MTSRIEALQAEPAEIRKRLPIPYVMERYGHYPAEADATRLRYYSPFRPDNNPSFDVFLNDAGEQRWGDYAEGSQGGVIDLFKRFDNLESDGQAIAAARNMYAEFVESGWIGFQIENREAFDPRTMEERLAQGEVDGERRIAAMLGSLIYGRPGLGAVQASHLYQSWGLRADPETDGGVLVPYRNREGVVTAAKVRWPDAEQDKRSVAGSRLTLYGLWRMREGYPVLLVEGETDAWAADSVLRERFDVIAVPGAGQRPDRMGGDLLSGRQVYICFDGDEAGRAGAMKWSAHLNSKECEVLVIPMPPGRDIATLHLDQIATLAERARPLHIPPVGFFATDTVYVRSFKENSNFVSNWRLNVRRVLRGQKDDMAFEGELVPHRREVVLPSEAMASQQALIRWANAYGAVWTGSGGDHQKLLQWLLHESTFLPEGRMTRQVGWHDGDFVWPGGSIGTQDWTYVPPPSRVSLEGRVHIKAEPCRPVDVLAALYSLHRPEIMGPILAWLAVAPLRPLFAQFPILSISGASGTGKSTLTEKVLRIFSGSEITANLTSTTPYAVTSFFAASNAIPIWFDEYRPGAREDAKSQLDQLLRDTYTGQPSWKGGLTDNKAEVTEIPTVVPVVVTGEESFIETSHTDRMVLVRLTKEGRGNLALLDQVESEGFAHAYLSWLFGGDEFGETIRSIEIKPTGPAHLNDRQRVNLGVLVRGWELLKAFAFDLEPLRPFPELDLSGVTNEAATAQQSNPLLDAIRWASEGNTYHEAVWTDENYVYVSPVNLLKEVATTKAFILPTSNEKGVRALLQDQHGGELIRTNRNGGKRRCIRLPKSEVFPDEQEW